MRCHGVPVLHCIVAVAVPRARALTFARCCVLRCCSGSAFGIPRSELLCCVFGLLCFVLAPSCCETESLSHSCCARTCVHCTASVVCPCCESVRVHFHSKCKCGDSSKIVRDSAKANTCSAWRGLRVWGVTKSVAGITRQNRVQTTRTSHGVRCYSSDSVAGGEAPNATAAVIIYKCCANGGCELTEQQRELGQ